MNSQQAESGFRRVVADVFDLCELQWQLLSVDGEEATRRAVRAAIFCGAAGIIGLASICGAVIGVGWLLHEQFNWPVSGGLLVAAAGGLIIAGVAGLIGFKLLSGAAESMAETKREFAENIRWIKGVIVTPNTSPRNQIRKESFPPSAETQNGRSQNYFDDPNSRPRY